jgi:hypothetical protein
MQRWIALGGILLLCLLLLAACAEEEEEFTFHCPRCDETVTWDAYGGFRFGNVGDDATARRLVAECGWHVQGGHNGGVGDTLQVAACSQEGVILVWAFNSLHAVRLADGWTGTTENGIGLGDSVTDFLTVYPDFSRVDDTLYIFTKGEIEVEARFERENEQLEELIVGRFFRP